MTGKTSGLNSKHPDSSWDDEALIAACLGGQQAAWDALVDRYSSLVYSIPARYQLPPDEAADVFQNVWLDLYRGLAALRNAAALRSWLLTTASRRCLRHKRRRQRALLDVQAEEGLPEPSPDPQLLQENAERRYLLNLALARLPDRCRQLLEMLFFEQPPVPYAEAARRLSLAEGSIGFIRGRCLVKLRKELSQLEME
jgi:RNA polymerase sigma factor (sigma-70 family)